MVSLSSLSCHCHCPLTVTFAMCMALLVTLLCWCHHCVIVAASSTLLLVVQVSSLSPHHPRCCAYMDTGVVVFMLAWTLCGHHRGHVAHAGCCHMVMAVWLTLLLDVTTCMSVGAGSSPLSLTQVVVVVMSHGHLCHIVVMCMHAFVCLHGTVGR